MTMLVTLAEAKAHLRYDTDDGDNDLTLKIHGASGAVLNYLETYALRFLDETGNPIKELVPFEVKSAVLLMVGYLDRYRDEDPEKAYQMGFIPAPVTALLYPLRTPVIA